MLQILEPARTTKEYAYRRIFRSDYEAFGFVCDEEGNPIFRNPCDEKRYRGCLEKSNKYKDHGREKREYTHTYPAIARCECGSTLKLERMLNRAGIRCRCGRYYSYDGEEIPAARNA